MKNKKIVAIIQARMGSTRLPGKISMKLSGIPMLLHIYNRVNESRLIDQIGVATTVNKLDNETEELCKKNNIKFYRGSENDVLDRFYNAAKLWESDIVLRITGDCPLIDPIVIDKIISSYLENHDKFKGANNIIKRTYPRGLDTELFLFDVLEKVFHNAKKDYQREHVTPYIYENPNLFPILSIENNKDLSGYRWTVDTKEDFNFVKEVYKRLYNQDSFFLMKDILSLLEKEPKLLKINSNIKQEDITGYGNNIILRLAVESDSEDIWNWRNHNDVRKWCFNNEIIDFNKHNRWFKKAINDKNIVFYIAELENTNKIGQVRFNIINKKFAQININLNPKYINKGLGSKIVNFASKKFLENYSEINEIQAEIVIKNIASIKSFEKAGYKFSHNSKKNDIPMSVYLFKG